MEEGFTGFIGWIFKAFFIFGWICAIIHWTSRDHNNKQI